MCDQCETKKKLVIESTDNMELLLAVKAKEIVIDIAHFMDQLRAIWKYQELTDDQQEIVDEIKNIAFEFLAPHTDLLE